MPKFSSGVVRSTRAILALVLFLTTQWRLIADSDATNDWPRFLGPDGNNISTETRLAQKWSTNGVPLLWQKEIGPGYGAPSVLGGKLVLHHRMHEEEVVQCFDPATGESLWRYGYPSGFTDPFGYNNGPRCTPILHSNRCYSFGAEGRLCCLDLETGKPVWQRETTKEWTVPDPFFGVGSTPLLEGDKLIVMVGGQPNSAVVALDPATSKTLWENGGQTNWQGAATIGWRGEAPYRWTGEEKMASYSSPVAATIHGRRTILCLTRQGLLALNPTNGAIYFSRWFQSPVNESVNAMCPVVRNDLVLISAAYYRVGAVLLRVLPDGKSVEEVWRSPKQTIERLPDDGGMAPPVLEIHWTTPILHDGYLYAFSGRNEPDARFRCVEFETGNLMWSRDERWRPHSGLQPSVYGRGSAIIADGRLIVLGEGGKLGMFSLNSRHAEEICSWQVPQLHFPCWTAPVLSKKRLYLRSEDRLVCLDVSGDAKKP
jgi:outer membrane protein assembly factor BamB